MGRPQGNYDRLLDYSRAVTGGLFFVPSATLLEALADRSPEGTAPAASDSSQPASPALDDRKQDGALDIGSLKGRPQYE